MSFSSGRSCDRDRGQASLLEPLARRVAGAQRLDAPKQCGDARQQVLDAGAFRQVVVGAEPEPRHGIELAFAGRQEDDRQLRRSSAQLAAQLEAALRPRPRD